MSEASPWFIERYSIARRIWAIKDQRAHDGFESIAGRNSVRVPAQTWAEWFEWAYGMSLADYAKIASEGKHADQIPADAVVLCEYKCTKAFNPDSWLIVRGAPGETYEELSSWLKRNFPSVTETRPRK